MMQINSTQSILGWQDDRLKIENRRVYNYESGNDVTVVEKRSIEYMLYTDRAVVEVPAVRGEKVDKTV